jgi:hypothetical protein
MNKHVPVLILIAFGAIVGPTWADSVVLAGPKPANAYSRPNPTPQTATVSVGLINVLNPSAARVDYNVIGQTWAPLSKLEFTYINTSGAVVRQEYSTADVKYGANHSKYGVLRCTFDQTALIRSKQSAILLMCGGSSPASAAVNPTWYHASASSSFTCVYGVDAEGGATATVINEYGIVGGYTYNYTPAAVPRSVITVAREINARLIIADADIDHGCKAELGLAAEASWFQDTSGDKLDSQFHPTSIQARGAALVARGRHT